MKEHKCPLAAVTIELLRQSETYLRMLIALSCEIDTLQRILKEDLGYTDAEFEEITAQNFNETQADFFKAFDDFKNELAPEITKFEKDLCKDFKNDADN